MEKSKEITELKSRIKKIWTQTRTNISENIKRGHTRSISTDVEDSIALFISAVLDNKVSIYIDPSISVGGKTHRPDLLIVKDGTIIALVEIKANMGWCREAKTVIDNEIVDKHVLFSKEKTLKCKFSNEELTEVEYKKDAALFFIALTAQNGGEEEQIQNNISYALSKGVNHYLLFDGWYDTLKNRDIEKFADALCKLV